MAFSDTDLEDLKESIRLHKENTSVTPDTIRVVVPFLEALICRLEAAERCAESYGSQHPKAADYLAWRKAAGK